MAKEVVISTSGLNCYGSRVLTSGIDLSQYRKNPVLLWMHRRGYEEDAMPIGRIEGLRVDGDRLIGTPVFDQEDEFARKVESKWEHGFLRMASAGLEILELSDAPEHLIQGQTRPTVTRCRLEEVSIVDIGGNDEALQLYYVRGRGLRLSAGETDAALPLLGAPKTQTPPDPDPDGENRNPKQQQNQMNKELLELLGLPETASEQEVIGSVRLLKEQASQVESLKLSSITSMVDGAIADKRVTPDKREHFIDLGKRAGCESLRETLSLLRPTQKPTDIINKRDDQPGGHRQTYAKLSDVPASERAGLRDGNPAEYMRLYKAEYGIECEI